MSKTKDEPGSHDTAASADTTNKDATQSIVIKKEQEVESKDEKSDDGDVAMADAVAAEGETVEKDEVDEETRRKEEEARKERWKDYPMKQIEDPHEHDVLYGRGGGTNHHPGNKRYRKMVEDRKIDYVNSKRLDKPLVALDIIRVWRNQDPPGRFLKLDEKTKKWNDVGDKKAREKTSQALREKAPLIRKHLEEERMSKVKVEESDDETDQKRSASFAKGTNKHDGARDEVSKAVLARDHTLGREYMNASDEIALEGFSWQDPLKSGTFREAVMDGRTLSHGSFVGPPPPSPHGAYGYRWPSYGSVGTPPPPPPAAYQHMTSGEERHRMQSGGRYGSWGPAPGYGWNEREHSLCHNPLPHASVGPVSFSPFRDSSRGPSGPWPTADPRMSWGPPPPGSYPHYPYPSGGHPAAPYHSPPREYSGSRPVHYSSPVPARRRPTGREPPERGPHSPAFEVDPAVASTWSGRSPDEIAKTWSQSSGDEGLDVPRLASEKSRRSVSPKRKDSAPRPDIVKRATSNQNETLETKRDLRGPSVKRCALNRDSSAAANRLKEQYIPGFKRRAEKQSFDMEARMLSSNLEQIRLDSAEKVKVKPKPLSTEGRTNTLDEFGMDLMVKPSAISTSTRSSTIEALAIDALNDDFMCNTDAEIDHALDLAELPDASAVIKPSTLTFSDRMSTTDFNNLMGAPLDDDEAALLSGKRKDGSFDPTEVSPSLVEGV